MNKIIFDSGISLDGFFAGDNRSPKNPMGGVSGQIHSWMFNQKAFWEYLGFEGGKEVVAVEYNPSIISKAELDKIAQSQKCAVSTGGS